MLDTTCGDINDQVSVMKHFLRKSSSRLRFLLSVLGGAYHNVGVFGTFHCTRAPLELD